MSPNERLEVETIELAATGTITDNPPLASASVNKPNNITEDGLTPNFNLGFPGEIPPGRTAGWNIQVDGILPYISSVTSGTPVGVTPVTPGTADGTYGIGDLIDITINFNEAVWYTQTLSLPVTFRTSNITFDNIAVGDIATSKSVEITIVEGDDSGDTDGDDELDAINVDVSNLIVASGTVKDAAGNELDETNPGGLTLPAGSNLADVHEIIVDGIRPTRPTIQAVTATGGNVVANIWNSTNTGVIVRVPILDTDDDNTLIGGTILIYGKIGENTGTYVPLVDEADAQTIDNADYVCLLYTSPSPRD